MSQQRRADDMRRMLGVLNSGLKLAGRAFRTFELVNANIIEQFTLKDGVFPDQMPTPPVHTLYEGFESIGKTLTAFEETMSQISDTHWRKSAKRWGEKRPDDVENEDWINTNAARVPDPKPPIEILEQGFVTLHSTFDVFDSFMKKQRESEEGEVLSVPASLGKGKARTPDTGTEVESGSKGKKPIGQDSAKYHVSHSNKLDDRQISLPVRSADTEKSPSLAAEPSIKHPYDNQGSANRDELRPLKRRAVTGRERETAAAPAVLPHPRKAETWQTPVQPSRFGRPELETGYSVRSSNDRGTARDRSHSMASQLTRSTNRPSLDRRQEKMVPQASRSLWSPLISVTQTQSVQPMDLYQRDGMVLHYWYCGGQDM